jgi:hypothetical protein
VSRVILAFRPDNQVIFGVSIDDAEESSGTVVQAREILTSLAESYGGHRAFIGHEVPPPLFEFPPIIENVVFSWEQGQPNPPLQPTAESRGGCAASR